MRREDRMHLVHLHIQEERYSVRVFIRIAEQQKKESEKKEKKENMYNTVTQHHAHQGSEWDGTSHGIPWDGMGWDEIFFLKYPMGWDGMKA